ncbi:MAG: TolC family outer membrane protein [Gammaproteobacteria bacterium]|nr:TolC family outer membrane protein [Gammaproteobacteria bacterium]MCP5458649.1 TolC family outer membrane protein [Gammaproteobacteria bacterium]
MIFRFGKYPAVLGLLCLTSAPTAWSVDLMEAYRQALDSDPQLRAAASDRLASQETRNQARALLLPSLNAGAVQSRDFAVHTNVVNADSSFSSHTYSVDVVQPLFNQASNVRVRQAESVIDQAEADFVTAQQDLIVRVTDRYFGVLSALSELIYSASDKNAIARQLEQAKRRFEVGLTTITDVFEAQARYDLADADVISARNAVADAVEALREVTGRSYDEIEDLSEDAPLNKPDPADPEAWVRLALDNNPQLLSAAFGVEVSRENINLQKAGHYPNLDLTAGYTDNDTGTIETNGAAVSLRLNIPLYQGGAVVSQTREAAYQHESAKERLEQLQRQILRQVRDSYRGLETAISRVRAFDQARVSNRSSLEATEAGFEVGTRTIVDVLDAQRDLFLAERNYAQSRYDYILNFLRLKQAGAQLSVQDLETLTHWLRIARSRQQIEDQVAQEARKATQGIDASGTLPPPPAPGR